MRSHITRSTRDRSIPRSLQRWVSIKSSISQLASFLFYNISRSPVIHPRSSRMHTTMIYAGRCTHFFLGHNHHNGWGNDPHNGWASILIMVEATILAMVEPQAILTTVRASRFWSLEDFRICLPSSIRAELRTMGVPSRKWIPNIVARHGTRVPPFSFSCSVPSTGVSSALLFSLPPSCNSDPASRSRHFSPLPTTVRVRALPFYREKGSALCALLVDSRRIAHTHAARRYHICFAVVFLHEEKSIPGKQHTLPNAPFIIKQHTSTW